MAFLMRTTPRTTLGATRARQGRLGRHVLWVLLVSLLLVVLGFFAAWTWKAPDLNRAESKARTHAVDARKFDAPAPAVVQQGADRTQRPGGAS
jgi:hypothetical protein